MDKPRQRRHHTVPKFFLRQFASDDRLWVYDMVEQTSFVTHVDNVAVERDFHTYTFPGEDPDDGFEHVVSVAEGVQAAGFRDLGTRWPPAEQVRGRIAYFAALQAVRSPRWREISLGAQGEAMRRMAQMMATYAQTNKATRAGFRKVLPEGLSDADVDAVIEYGARGDYDVVLDPQEHLRQILQVLQDEELPTKLMNRAWTLVHAPEGYEFVISDHPATLWSLIPGPVGMVTADEVRIPLDRRRLIILSFDERAEGKRRLATPDMVEHLNRGTGLHAKRYLYGNPSLARNNRGSDVASSINAWRCLEPGGAPV